jgi:hypothetical protein
VLTTFAKKVGGPYKLVGALLVGGYIVLRFAEGGVKKIVHISKGKIAKTSETLQSAFCLGVISAVGFRL